MPAPGILLELDGLKGERTKRTDTASSDHEGSHASHIESFSWSLDQSGARASGSHFDGRLLTADDLKGEQAASAAFEAFGGFNGGVVVGGRDDADALPGGLTIAASDIDGGGLAKHEQYLTLSLSDTLIAG